jgi:hypothetical protein
MMGSHFRFGTSYLRSLKIVANGATMDRTVGIAKKE